MGVTCNKTLGKFRGALRKIDNEIEKRKSEANQKKSKNKK